MISFEKVIGLPLEEAKKIASGEGESFPDVIYTISPTNGRLSRRSDKTVTRVIGINDGRFIVAEFNEYLVMEGKECQ